MDETLIISVVLGYFAVLIGIMYYSSKGATNDTFFLGERKSPWYLVAFGMIGASLSGVTFISVPGWVGTSGFSYMQVVFGYLVGYIIVALVLLPIYYKMNLTSIYGYLQHRFGYWSYKTGAAFFLLSRIIGASIRLLLVADVLQEILLIHYGVPFEVTVVLSVALIWVYTNRGGIKTIIWTDTLQTAFMLFAVGLAVWIIGDQLDLGEKGGLIASIQNSGMATIFSFDDAMSGSYFWKSFIGGMFITIGMTGLDQDMMQKNLSCKNVKESKKNMISMALVLVVVNLVFLGLGALLFMYSEQTGIGADMIAGKRTDLLFSSIAMHSKTGAFLGVTFLLGLIAAAYSSADSALTSLTTSLSFDFLDIEKKAPQEQETLRKRVHIIMSVVLILVVIILKYTVSGNAIWTLIKLAGFTYGPLIGLFFFGILTKRNLKDHLVLPVSVIVPVVMGILWAFSKGGALAEKGANGLFGSYVFGAELIVYNAIFAFVALYVISETEDASTVSKDVLDL